MKAPKNFEAIFLAATVLCTLTAYATAKVPANVSTPAAQVSVATHVASNVVVVKAKRLTAAQKAALN